MTPLPARVAVITRTIDRPVLLERTLQSLLSQTFTHWHWVVVTPDPETSVNPLLATHRKALLGRVTVLSFQSPAPGMRGAPLNHGILHSDSEFITILDDDDTWDGRFLESMVRVLDSPVGKLAAGAICQTRVIEETSVRDGLSPIRDYVLNPDLRSLTLPQLAIVNQFCIHAFLYRRSALEETGLYPEDLPVLEDWYFNLSFLARKDVVVLPEVLTNYHQRPSAASGPEANSVVVEIDSHKFFESRIINEHLRKDWISGRSGLGHLLAAAAQTRILQNRLHTLEGKIRIISEKTGKIDARTKDLKDVIVRPG